MPNPAAVAYEAYREARNSDGTSNAFLVGWRYLTKEEKSAWWAVVRALCEKTGIGEGNNESEKI